MLLINKGYEAGVKVLYAEHLTQIVEFYKVACLQEYIYENHDITEEDALKITKCACRIMGKAEPEDPIPESTAIRLAAEELQICLQEQE